MQDSAREVADGTGGITWSKTLEFKFSERGGSRLLTPWISLNLAIDSLANCHRSIRDAQFLLQADSLGLDC